MTLEQWEKLVPDNVVQYGSNKYKLLFKDTFGYWLVEVYDLLNKVCRFKKLQVHTKNVRGFRYARL